MNDPYALQDPNAWQQYVPKARPPDSRTPGALGLNLLADAINQHTDDNPGQGHALLAKLIAQLTTPAGSFSRGLSDQDIA